MYKSNSSGKNQDKRSYNPEKRKEKPRLIFGNHQSVPEKSFKVSPFVLEMVEHNCYSYSP